MSELLDAASFNPYTHVLTEPRNIGPLPEAPASLFDPTSPIRRWGELVTVLGLGAIAGDAILKDSIAAGVAVHSRFEPEPWQRIDSTGMSATRLTFEGEAEFHHEASRLFSFHSREIKGVYQGVHYDANNGPDQVWVWVSTFNKLKAANNLWGKRRDDEDELLWHDFRDTAISFGTPEPLIPETVAEVHDYTEAMIEGPYLLQTPVSRDMAQRVYRFESRQMPRALGAVAQAVTIGLLDPRLRERAGIELTTRDRQINNVVNTMIQQTYRRLPESRREQIVPAYIRLRHQLAPAIRVAQTIRHNLANSKQVA